MWFKKETTGDIAYWHIVLVGLVVVVSLVLRLVLNHWPQALIKIGKTELKVLVADTYAHWYKGLSGRKNLGKYGGMIFVFPEKANHVMVMRDMLFSLDVIWIDGDTVVDMVEKVLPEATKSEADLTPYTSHIPANIVLEVPAGFIEANGISIGDKVEVVRNK